MHGQYTAEYQRAMVTEVKALTRQRTWKRVSRNKAPLDDNGDRLRLLKGT